MTWLAFDIGGANLKLADGSGYTAAIPFPLWKESERLTAALATMLAAAPPAERLAITMTGELADCFASKREGVAAILQSVRIASDQRDVQIYLTDGRFVSPDAAQQQPMLAAASNWHALTQFAVRFASSGTGLLVDVGSTTCDVIPFDAGRPITQGQTDTTRLLAGELIYTGIERSPCCAIAPQVSYRGELCPVAQELFATMRDVYILLGELPESDDTQTADGRPATRVASQRRLARMIAADDTECDSNDLQAMARSFADAQTELLTEGIRRVIARLREPPPTVILSGHGEFLTRWAFQKLGLAPQFVSLTKQLGEATSRCATAHALAVLAREAFR